jgi:hypothetical protein
MVVVDYSMRERTQKILKTYCTDHESREHAVIALSAEAAP